MMALMLLRTGPAAGGRRTRQPPGRAEARCRRHPPQAALAPPSRRALLLGGGLALLAPAAPPAAASAASGARGLELQDALVTTLRAQQVLSDLLPAAGRDPAAAAPAVAVACEALAESLPVVGASAAYNQKDWRLQLRGTPADSMVNAFAFLDRAADGASGEGPNRNISIADIERLERLEEATQDVLDTLCRLSRDLGDLRGGTDSPEGAGGGAARGLRGAVAGIGELLGEVPGPSLAAARAAAAAGGGPR